METNIPNSRNELSGFSDELDDLVVQHDASRGERFGNYIIDVIIASVISRAFFAVIYGRSFLEQEEFAWDTWFTSVVLSSVFMLAFYTLMEGLLKGRSIGKFLTGTKAVRRDGQPFTFGDAFYRSLVRIVPFEVFSGFGTPWHDQWTGTTVVKNK
ncbi:RDD family protein [uncultured Chitinophaga sp.]|uniref:RDD family protein n=1 Tax=uncultured Chitinophaga sp. TaxID=339340 RepID=UPI0025D3A9C0|nr:RDD family protein [uncultured Chitinophaga sp.]